MLSTTSRWLTYLNAVLYTVLGVLLYILPETLAPVFAWKVTAFMTMTLGGWCLGNAWLAWITAYRWKWNLVYSALLYLWLFGVGELWVLFFFRDKLVLTHPVAWFYLITLIINALAAIVGVIDWLRIRPALASSGPRITAAAFVYIRLFDFAARPGGLLYFAAYFGVGIPLLFVFRRFGTGSTT